MDGWMDGWITPGSQSKALYEAKAGGMNHDVYTSHCTMWVTGTRKQQEAKEAKDARETNWQSRQVMGRSRQVQVLYLYWVLDAWLLMAHICISCCCCCCC
jgi:hypothetical protein